MDNISSEARRSVPEYKGNLADEFRMKMRAALEEYEGQKTRIKERIRENNLWYSAQYSRAVNYDKNSTEPATAFIFNAIENKYADAVDNYPQPNFIEREPSDAKAAKILSGVVPVILEQSRFKRVYKRSWMQKLKQGTAIYGVFFDEEALRIKITDIDIMNFYCDIHVKDIQDSPFIFVESIVPNDELKSLYPEYAPLFTSDATANMGDGSTAVIRQRTKIYDCYYKKYTENGWAVHMAKLCGEYILDATEDSPEGYENGLYDHGKYPFVIDVMYPDDSCIFGLGVVDMVKNPQMYIDKIDGIIAKNAMLAGKKRFLIKDSGGINEAEFSDASVDIVHCAGGVNEDNVREIQVSPLDGFIADFRQTKINELKEVIGNRDFQQGGTSGGVTAASAITVLQQAGEKISRAVIDDSYDAYKEVVEMVVELMRQFMTEEEVFRITNDAGGVEYEPFSGAMLYDAAGLPSEDARPLYFDIDIVPQRQNPFSREANNSTVLQLWSAGFFDPQRLDMALIALPAMTFDGRDKIVQALQTYKQQQEQAAQMMPQGGQFEDMGGGLTAVDIGGSADSDGGQFEDIGGGLTA